MQATHSNWWQTNNRPYPTNLYIMFLFAALNACVLGDLQSTVGLVINYCLNGRCDPQTFPSSDISAKKSFPKAPQTQVVPRDHHPVMQECWQQKELMAPRLPKLNVVICKSQSNHKQSVLYMFFFYGLRAWNMISGLKKFLPEISAASQSGFYFFQCLMTKRRMRGTCCSRF